MSGTYNTQIVDVDVVLALFCFYCPNQHLLLVFYVLVCVCVFLNGSLQYTSSICAEVFAFDFMVSSAFWFLLFFHPKNLESLVPRHPSDAPCFLHSICDTCKFMQFLLKPNYVFRTSMSGSCYSHHTASQHRIDTLHLICYSEHNIVCSIYMSASILMAKTSHKTDFFRIYEQRLPNRFESFFHKPK